MPHLKEEKQVSSLVKVVLVKQFFLKSLLGLHSPEQGIISFDGNISKEMNVDQKRQLRQEIGMVFQGSALFDSLTVEENIMFPVKMFTNQPASEMRDRVHTVLKRVNLPDAHQKFPAELSGGMQKTRCNR